MWTWCEILMTWKSNKSSLEFIPTRFVNRWWVDVSLEFPICSGEIHLHLPVNTSKNNSICSGSLCNLITATSHEQSRFKLSHSSGITYVSDERIWQHCQIYLLDVSFPNKVPPRKSHGGDKLFAMLLGVLTASLEYFLRLDISLASANNDEKAKLQIVESFILFHLEMEKNCIKYFLIYYSERMSTMKESNSALSMENKTVSAQIYASLLSSVLNFNEK